MSDITKNHKALLQLLCSKTQSGELGVPDLEDLDFVGQIHSLLEEEADYDSAYLVS